jgi:hypothetical protein
MLRVAAPGRLMGRDGAEAWADTWFRSWCSAIGELITAVSCDWAAQDI